MGPSDDPTTITEIVLDATDLVTALEASERRDRAATLRITPPFSGRMRARLHVDQAPPPTDPEPVIVSPQALVGDGCPDPPSPDDVEDEIRAAPDDDYSVERHRERYQAALREWRRDVPQHVVDATTLPGYSHRVTVTVLGDVSA